MTNKEIARYLKETASLIELTGGNAFKARAFANASRQLQQMDERALDLVKEGTLEQIKGFGKGLVSQIEQLIATGSFDQRETLLGAIPPGLLEMLQIKGLGAKKVRVLWQKRGLTTVDALEEAAAAGHLETLDGFGARTQENIIKNIRLLRQYNKRRRINIAHQYAEGLLACLENAPHIDSVFLTGELRRDLDTIGRVEVLAQTASLDPVSAFLVEAGFEAAVNETGAVEGTFQDAFPFIIHQCDQTNQGSRLWETTGPASHCEAYIDQFGQPDPAEHEETLYSRADLAWVPPVLRDSPEALHAATNGQIPSLVQVADIHGTLHNHSTYSDGAHSLKEMADAARSMGMSYFGICDHSQSLVIANGLAPDRVAKQQQEIALLNEQYAQDGGTPFRIYSGIESDILTDGSLDYPEEVLASFDFIVASVHVKLSMDQNEATERVLKAVENPYTSILGHPTGRLLLMREGYPLDYDIIFDACAKHKVAIELNANPHRLDLDWRLIQDATRRGILIAINPDAHAIKGLQDMHWGVRVARKGWLEPQQCLNAKTLEQFDHWIRSRK